MSKNEKSGDNKISELQAVECISTKSFISQYKKAAYEEDFQKVSVLLNRTNSDEAVSIIHAEDDEIFCIAAWHGHIESMQLLLELTPDTEQRDKMIHSNNDRAFINAAQNGCIKVIIYLINITPNEELLYKMIHANNDEAFKKVAGPIRITEAPTVGIGGYSGYGSYDGDSGRYGELRHYDRIYGSWIYGSGITRAKRLEDGRKDLIKIFLGLEPDYFENLAKVLKITPKTVEFVAKTILEVKEIREHNIQELALLVQSAMDTYPIKLPTPIYGLIAQYAEGYNVNVIGLNSPGDSE